MTDEITTMHDHDALLDDQETLNEVLTALRVPTGVLAEDYAELLADVFEEIVGTVGLDAIRPSELVEHASADDLIALLRGDDLPEGSRLWAVLRKGAA